MTRFFPKISVGSVVKVIRAPDQNKYIMQRLWDMQGVVLKNVIANSSPSLYEVYLEDGNMCTFHYLDLEVIFEKK